MFPFVHTQVQCKLSIFHPSVYPWFEDIPYAPIKPEEPTIETVTQESMFSGMTPHLARSSEGTENALHQISLDHMTPSEIDEWERMMSGDGKHDMRDSNKFKFDRTIGNL